MRGLGVPRCGVALVGGACAAFAGACVGGISEPAAGGRELASSSGGGTAGGTGAGGGDRGESAGAGAGAGPAATPGGACSTDPGPAPAPLRRLGHAEYNATVRDLLPAIELPAFELVSEVDGFGFENRAFRQNPAEVLIEQLSTAAAQIAERAVANLKALLPCTPSASGEAACGAQFIDTFGARAFRRPLAPAETKAYTDFFNQQRATAGFSVALQLTVEALLQAPAFLYRLEWGDPATLRQGRVRLTDHEIASRLSYLLWQSVPDTALLEAARARRLWAAAEVEAHARRMLKDPRARPALIEFHRQWLELDRIEQETKDPRRYPSYTDALRTSIRSESDRFVASVMFDGDATLKSLLTNATTEVDTRLAQVYRTPPPPSGAWAKVALAPGERAGFLTRANFLASHAHAVDGSPVLRAVFVLGRLLCAPPAQPPPDVNTAFPTAETGKTNRQRFEQKTSPATCRACHQTMDPIGYGFENYDAVGQYRTMDNGLPVDATGELKNVDVAGPFRGAIELSQKLSASAELRSCLTTQWWQFAFGRDKGPADECRIRALDQAVASAGGDTRELLVALATSEEFLTRPVVKP